MRLSATTVSIGLLLLAGAGCGKKDDAGGGDKAGSSSKAGGKAAGGKAAGAKASDTFASRTLDMKEFSVTFDAPTGWKEREFGGGLLFTKPGGVFASTLMVGQTCEGGCSKIPANIKGMTAVQVKMHASYYPTATIVKEGPVSAGGGEFELALAGKNGRKATQYKLVRFQDGWDRAVSCNAMLLKDDAKQIARFKALCNGMKITKKKTP